MLSTTDHRRDYSGFRYVYPVVSRRAGGVSVGINLNPNNACNWACIYCQVPDLTRGGPPPIDLELLQTELQTLLTDIVRGTFLQEHVAEDSRRLMDIAFSGNGEPTSADEFPAAVDLVVALMRQLDLLPDLKLRLITNGSLMHREGVQTGIRTIGAAGGEVWFKVDRGTEDGIEHVNGIRLAPARTLANLETCAALADTWVQTCWFGIDGSPPSAAEELAYLDLITPVAQKIKGVHLYGLARPSLQPDAARLQRLPAEALERLAGLLAGRGIAASVSP